LFPRYGIYENICFLKGHGNRKWFFLWYRFNSVTGFAASQLLKNFVDGNFVRKLMLHQNRRAAGSIPVRGPTV
jgi:hypothetical protein